MSKVDGLHLESSSEDDCRRQPSVAASALDATLLMSNDDLRKVDSAIQMRLKLNRALQGRLTFDDFYSLLRKAEVERPRLELVGENDEELDTSERLLFEFLAVLSPSLYKIYHGRNIFRDNNLSWFLESTFAGTSQKRNDELSHCLRSRASTASSESKLSIIEAIKDHRGEVQAQTAGHNGSTGPSLDNVLQIDSRATNLIRPGMTIDERVQARATAKRLRTEEFKLVESDDGTRRSFLIQLANGLWQHSSFILTKRQKIMSPGRKATMQSSLILTLQDAVESLKRTMTVSSSTMVNRGESVTKRQLVNALEDLARIAPEFIVISSEYGNKSGNKVTKNSTVWLNPSKFKSARAKLSGEVGDASSSRHSALSLCPNAQSKGVSSADGQLSKYAPATSRVVTADSRKSILIASPSIQQAPTGTKRAAQDSEQSVATSCSKKQKGVLRINPNLILSPADHTGGEIIDILPMHSSPRGLKRLLHQMKDGQRI
ncbi:hypothetical protein MPSEU_000276300 [Mayamaea pseudoterrestris]|nr:hypothetical protein MPSEU_000276300 [Mayamaea pseudoterrestris]